MMPEKSDPRIDLLIYAHDGRGLGHVSRSIAIGAAVRRLDPKARVLLLTGYRATQSLIGPVPLDWIKLPAYAKVVVDGQPRARIGATNLKNSYLVASRTRLILSVVNEYRPRCVLVDHEPQGKRRELLPAIYDGFAGCWVLGIRGVVGRVEDVWSSTAAVTFRDHYSTLLWYGDTNIHGHHIPERLTRVFGQSPTPTGYVSRLKELGHWMPAPTRNRLYAGTVALPWQTEEDGRLLDHLHEALAAIGDQYGPWRLFLNTGIERFNRLPFCTAQPPGIEYVRALAQSKIAVIFGGYNSVTDVLASRLPAVVILRDIHDREQHEHLAMLTASPSTAMLVLEEHRLSAAGLQQAIRRQLAVDAGKGSGIDLDGAQSAAATLLKLIRKPGT